MNEKSIDRSRSLLVLRGVSKHWPRRPEPVLDGVNLDVAPGNVVAVRGRNGAGKTTLLRIAAGMLTADAGEVEIGGVTPDADRRAFQRRIGYVSAGNGALYARLSVDRHLALWSRLAMLRRDDHARAAAAVRSAFALDELRGQRVDRLSAGQRQRLRLALGFMHQPEVVLLDEPENSLDEEAAALLARALEAVKGRGGGALVCSPSGSGSLLPVDDEVTVSDGRLVRA